MKRTLSLRREALTELPASDLLAVAGGALPTTPLEWCLNTQMVCYTAAYYTRCVCETES